MKNILKPLFCNYESVLISRLPGDIIIYEERILVKKYKLLWFRFDVVRYNKQVGLL